jgi:hypothetical protein
LLVLRLGSEEYRVRGLREAFSVRASVEDYDWTFRARLPRVSVEGRIRAPASAFVGLRYRNPPGGDKHCLNSKIASCELRVVRDGGAIEQLTTASRAAFEILTDPRAHGITIRA